jgi:hypothetical protein
MSKKPSIVFCHGIWADGSCFNKLIPALQADGHDLIAVQRPESETTLGTR